MVSDNGSRSVLDAEEYRRRAQEAERSIDTLRAERDRIEAAMTAWQDRREEIQYAAAKADVAELAAQGVRRSLLSAKQKSEIIRSKGVDYYNQLPW